MPAVTMISCSSGVYINPYCYTLTQSPPNKPTSSMPAMTMIPWSGDSKVKVQPTLNLNSNPNMSRAWRNSGCSKLKFGKWTSALVNTNRIWAEEYFSLLRPRRWKNPETHCKGRAWHSVWVQGPSQSLNPKPIPTQELPKPLHGPRTLISEP